jgi:hypothetical protein
MHEDEEGNWHADPEFAISMPIADWRRLNRGEPMNDTETSASMRKLVEAVTAPIRPVQALISERHATHGNFADNARISQNLKAMLHGEDAWAGLEPHQQEALDMICTKISRVMSGVHGFADHWDDVGGYARLGKDPQA